MKKIKDKINTFIIKHKRGFTLVTVIISLIRTIEYIFFHTPEYGYDYTIEENLSFSIYGPIFACFIHYSSTIDGLPEKDLVDLYLLNFMTEFILCTVSILVTLGLELTPLGGILCVLPFFIVLLILLYNRKGNFAKASKLICADFKIWLKVFFNFRK